MLKIKFDVMLYERFVCTLTMEVEPDMIIDWLEDGQPVVGEDTFHNFVIEKRPSLKDKPFRIR